MSEVNAARRRRQYQCIHIAEKVRQTNLTTLKSETVLWREVIEALDQAEYLRRVLGHTDKLVGVVQARMAVDELRSRGIQMQLAM